MRRPGRVLKQSPVTSSARLTQPAGVLLAAGAGTRAGGPKALRRDWRGRLWVDNAAEVLLAGGCYTVVVVLGAASAKVRAQMTVDLPRVRTVEALDWKEGLGASLRAGLSAVLPSPAEAVLVHLVDLPDVSSAVVRRLLALPDAGPLTLARATYHGVPGHPVLIGAAHLPALLTELSGDAGAREYLQNRSVVEVECSDLATGDDRDLPGPPGTPSANA